MLQTKFIKYSFYSLFLALLWACSTRENTAMSRGYHATTTKYNVLYNGQLAYDKGIEELKAKYQDDFYEILTIERMQPDAISEVIKTDKNPNFQRAEEKAVKAAQTHSIYVAGTENNPQMDESYLLLGKARYHDLRYVPALEAFNYIVLKYPDSNIFYDASVWVQKTNLRLKYDNLAIKNLKKLLKEPDIKGQAKSDAYATLAQGYINIQAYDSVVAPLKEAISLSTKSEETARYKYILGQIYSRLGQKEAAIDQFQEVIGYGYKIPRMYIINAYAEKFTNQDIKQIDTTAFLKEYHALLKDRENRSYQDLIFHQMARLYNAYGNEKQAIRFYNRSLKKIKENEPLKVSNYRSLADIYYAKKEYINASKYYDSTMVNMNPSTRAYLEVKRKRNSLIDIVKYEQVVKDNDSVLRLVAMSEPERRAAIETMVAERKRADEAREKEAARANANNEGGSSLPTTGVASSFYFYSENSRNKGKRDFERRWGNRPLVDNWRWADEAQVNMNRIAIDEESKDLSETPEENEESEKKSAEDMRYNPEFFLAQIPSDESQIKSLKSDRDNAYYQLGTLYSDLLKEYEIAAERLERLLSLKPEERLIEPAKYHLYKIYSIINPDKATLILADMKTNHPNSQYTQVILNPNAKVEMADSPIDEYERIYKVYNSGAYTEALAELKEKIPTLINSELLSKYELLKAILTGKLNGLDEYQKALNYVAMTYPSSKEGKEAERILNRDLPKLQQLSFKMDLSRNIKMIYVVDYPYTEEGKALKSKLEEYASDRKHTGIHFSADIYSENLAFLVIHGVKSGNLARSAQVYLEIEKEYGIVQNPILISSDDYAVVLIKKNWEEYLRIRNGEIPLPVVQKEEEVPYSAPISNKSAVQMTVDGPGQEQSVVPKKRAQNAKSIPTGVNKLKSASGQGLKTQNAGKLKDEVKRSK